MIFKHLHYIIVYRGTDGPSRKQSVSNVGDPSSIPGSGIATHSSIIAWKIPMNRAAWRATVDGVVKSQTDWATNIFTFIKVLLTYSSVIK